MINIGKPIDKIYSLMICRRARLSGFGKMTSVKGKVKNNSFSFFSPISPSQIMGLLKVGNVSNVSTQKHKDHICGLVGDHLPGLNCLSDEQVLKNLMIS